MSKEDNKELIVEICDKNLIKSNYRNDPYFLADIDIEDDGLLIIYLVPPKYSNEIQLFIDGKYSKFSEEAKKKIIRYSGLIYKEKSDGSVEADQKILALLRDSRFRKYREQQLNVTLDEDAELYDLPKLDKEIWQE